MAAPGDKEIDYIQKYLIFSGLIIAIFILLKFIYRAVSDLSNANMSDAGSGDSPIPEDGVSSAEKKILVLGLDGSGKSSLLLALSKNENETPPSPTAGFNVISVQTDNTALNIWEIGGDENTRKYWSNFYGGSHMLVFVIDSSAGDERMSEVKAELNRVKADLPLLPLVIVANKQDMPNAKSVEEISNVLDLANDLDLASSSTAQNFQVVATQVPCGGVPVGTEDLQKILTGLD